MRILKWLLIPIAAVLIGLLGLGGLLPVKNAKATAITPIFCCGFEEGLATGANGHWTLTNATIQSTIKRTGTYALKCKPSNTIHNAYRTIEAGLNRYFIGRAYIYFTTLPTADSALITLLSSSSYAGVYFKQSDSKIYAGVGTSFGATGVSVSTDIWYCIDLDVDTSALDWIVRVKVDGVACGTLTISGTIADCTAIYLGNLANKTGEWYYDDIIISATWGDYPIGVGKVLAFSPTSDGTHSFTLNDFLYNAAGGSIAVAATDVYTYLDEIPLAGGSDFINQAVTRTTGYIEVCFADTTEANAPRGVEVMIANHQTNTNAGTSTFKLYDNTGTTEDTVLARTGAGSTALQYARKHYAARPAALGTWTVATFNDLRFRFGYSSDAAPDQYFDGVIIEAEFAVAAAPTITSTPTSKAWGTVALSNTSQTTINAFTITNTGDCAVDVTIQGTDFTGGDDTWDLSDDASVGDNVYGLKAGLDDDDDLFDIIVGEAAAITLKNNLDISGTQGWGLKIYMPSAVTGYDKQVMTATITLVCSAH